MHSILAYEARSRRDRHGIDLIFGVLRGGSWATQNRLEMQSSYRNVVDRNDRDVIYGFRCVLATPPASETENK
jgi:formylglycine-generating enzyme required for sulfatase activity